MNEVEKINIKELQRMNPIKRIRNKQISTFAIPITIGILMLIFGNVYVKLFGLLFVGFAVFVYIRFKDAIVADIYDDALVIYDQEDQSIGHLIAWNDIFVWDLELGQGDADSVVIETVSNEAVMVRIFGPARLTRQIEHFAPNRSKKRKLRDEQNHYRKDNSLVQLINQIFKRGK